MPHRDGTLTTREFILMLVICSLVTAVIMIWRWSVQGDDMVECEAAKLDLGRNLNDCAEDLEHVSQICDETARAALIRSTQLFECEESICRANGWLEPMDRFDPPSSAWEEREVN